MSDRVSCLLLETGQSGTIAQRPHGEGMPARTGVRARCFVAGGLLALFATVDIAAYAQAPGSPGRPPTRQERADERSPTARAGESYDPAGVRLGSFRLYPLL